MQKYPRFEDLRKDRDMTQAEIAEILQTTQQTYSLWESGKREMPLRHTITLAKYYNVSMDYIVSLTNDKKGGRKSWI